VSRAGAGTLRAGRPSARAYRGRRAALATMHGKEEAIAPALDARVGLAVIVPDGIDTDALGTFTRDVERPGSIEATAVAKARLGMRAAGLPIGVASEGSYGPHPAMPWAPAGLELLAVVDDERGLVVTEQLVDHAPVYASVEATPETDLDPFLRRVRFPSHGLVVSALGLPPRAATVRKGIRRRTDLDRALVELAAAAPEGAVRVETDQRAHQNPTRMATIARLAERLAERLATPCPRCAAPGFGRVRVEGALPCAACGGPSILVRAHVHGCPGCGHEEARPRPDGLREADPARCPRCNP